MKRAAQQLASLQKFQDVLKASAIAEEIECIDINANLAEALEIMNKRNFDVLGLSESGKVIGYLVKEQLEDQPAPAGTVCGSFKRDFEEADQVSESCPLEECVSLLQEKEHLLVHTSGLVHGIITRADLHKQPVRMLLFSVISLMEMTLLPLIREHYPEEALWMPFLSDERIEEAKDLLRKRQEAGMEIDLIDCLQLCDKGAIVRGTEALRELLGITSKVWCKHFFSRLERMRNALAHGQAFETVPNLPWEIAFETFRAAQAMLRKSIAALDADVEKRPDKSSVTEEKH